MLCNAVTLCDFTQFNSVKNINNRTLDLVLSNCQVSVGEEYFPLVKIDNHHPALVISVLDVNIKQNKLKKYSYNNFNSANYDSVNANLSTINWNDIFSGIVDVDILVNLFDFHINDVKGNLIEVKSSKPPKFPNWFKADTIKICKKKKQSHKKWKKFGKSYDFDTFSYFRAKLKVNIKKDHEEYLRFVEDNISSDVNYFWKFIKNKRSSNSVSIPANVSYLNKKKSSCYEECVEYFSYFFQSVYEPVDINKLNFPLVDNEAKVVIPIINKDELFRKIISLDPRKSMGPDGIPVIFLQKCAI